MCKIIFSGWDPGFNKVGLSKLLRTHLGFSLSEAKQIVDSILDEKEVTVPVSSSKLACTILDESIKLGVKGTVE